MTDRLAPTDLPVEEVVDGVRRALADRGVAVLAAPPGAGKTTVVPLRLLDEPWSAGGRILVLEPRRLAARAAAERMADLLGEPVGATAGYRTRDERKVGPRTRIEVVTEGILVRLVQDDPTLEGVGLVVLDEVHERSLVTDLSLALLVDVRRSLRPDLRVLAMSATLDAERFAAVLGGDRSPAPVVTSEGRSFPVAIDHQAPRAGGSLDAEAARAIAGLLAREPDGDVLAFLPGASDIRRVVERLRAPGALAPGIDVHPLFGALPTEEQDVALRPAPAGRRRVVVSTDIAESSLTVAGVRHVVDAGLVRVPRHDPSTDLTRLQTEPSSQASADQRAGRAGRLGPGTATRLWDRSEASRRPRWAVPEIAVADLTGLALEVAVWGTSLDDLALLDAPPTGPWASAQAVLRSLGALDESGRPTRRGRAMVELPTHPRLAALALAGVERGAGWTGAVTAAVLEERDVLRGRPGEVTADLVERVVLVAERERRHPQADRAAVASARRRARQIARRLGVDHDDGLQLDLVGHLVAVAHPERIAQRQAGGTGYRLRGGGGGALDRHDPLAGAAFLAVARIDAGPRGPEVRLAAELAVDDVAELVGDDASEVVDVRWDEERRDLRARTELRAGALVLSSRDGAAEPGDATTAAILARVRADPSLLPFTPAARRLQARLSFAHTHRPDDWPDVSDDALLATLEDWLVPLLPGLRSMADIGRVDLAAALGARLDHPTRQRLDHLAPPSFTAARGRHIDIDYSTGAPRSSMRAQDLYGTTVHPTVLDGEVPVVLELLSPARRPIQVTADLPGFWHGSWAAVRKDMAGRYPKHDWPVDPSRDPASGGAP